MFSELYAPTSRGLGLVLKPSDCAEYMYWRFGHVGPSSEAWWRSITVNRRAMLDCTGMSSPR
jgi:hypothetical protein